MHHTIPNTHLIHFRKQSLGPLQEQHHGQHGKPRLLCQQRRIHKRLPGNICLEPQLKLHVKYVLLTGNPNPLHEIYTLFGKVEFYIALPVQHFDDLTGEGQLQHQIRVVGTQHFHRSIIQIDFRHLDISLILNVLGFLNTDASVAVHAALFYARNITKSEGRSKSFFQRFCPFYVDRWGQDRYIGAWCVVSGAWCVVSG